MSTLSRTSSAASTARRSVSFSPPLLNDNVFPLHVTKLAQTLPERFYAACVSGSRAAT